MNTEDYLFFMLTVLDVAGEYVRSDIRDGEAGIEFVLDTQVLDVSTCEPVTNALVEIWRMFPSIFSTTILSPSGYSPLPMVPLY